METHPELQRPLAEAQIQCASPRVRTLTDLGDAGPLSGPASRCGAAGFLHPSAMRCASKASKSMCPGSAPLGTTDSVSCRNVWISRAGDLSKAVPSGGLRRRGGCRAEGHAGGCCQAGPGQRDGVSAGQRPLCGGLALVTAGAGR